MEIAMADKRGLEFVGAAFGLVTVAVVIIGAFVVKMHVDQDIPADGRPVIAASMAPVLR
jgi:hypothetical protein